MAIEIRLLGRPRATIDGRPLVLPVRRKGWALLAVLALADRPPSRRAVATLLFPDAVDPLGSLRWNLSRLRAGLNDQISLDGDPLVIRLEPGCRIDVLEIGTARDGSSAADLEPLLDGADGLAGPEFDLWLMTARHTLDPGGGSIDLDPGPARAAPGRAGVSTIDVRSRIEAGRAAMAAGAVPTGLDHLREAARLTSHRRNERLQANALLQLGGGLVHAVGSNAVEGIQALRDAARLAQRTGDRHVMSKALSDLAYVENAGGHGEPASKLLAAATRAAGDDASALSSVRAIEGMYLADRGQHRRALRVLGASAQQAQSSGRMRQAAWSTSIASRSLLQLGELEAARECAEQAARIASAEHWTAMLPWMESILAELDLAEGRTDEAENRLRHAWSLSLVLDDCCWQAMAARGLGLVAFARGRLSEALTWLDDAARLAAQEHDRYAWIQAWVLDGICTVSVAAELPRAATDIGRLGRVARASRQPGFAARADRFRQRC